MIKPKRVIRHLTIFRNVFIPLTEIREGIIFIIKYMHMQKLLNNYFENEDVGVGVPQFSYNNVKAFILT